MATTYESAEWSYNHRESLAEGLPPSCMVTGAVDLAGQIRSMRAQGYVIHGITVHTYCGTCQGTGRVRRKRSRSLFAFIPCKVCKAHEGPLQSTRYQVDGE